MTDRILQGCATRKSLLIALLISCTASVANSQILSGSQVATHAQNAGFQGNDLTYAVAYAYAESQFNAGAIGDNGRSFGLWQINIDAHQQYTSTYLLNPANNAIAAHQIKTDRGSWVDWCSRSGPLFAPHFNDAIGYAAPLDTTVVRAINDRIQATANLFVRDNPAGTQVGPLISTGSLGTIIEFSTPTIAPFGSNSECGIPPYYAWWKIRWDNGQTGWSAADFFKRTGSPSSPADLALQSIDVTQVNPVPGGAITIGNIVQNIGGTNSSSYTITFYASTDSTITPSDYSIGSPPTRASLAPGATDPNTSTNGNLPANLPNGTYYIGAIITISPDANATNNVNHDPTPITVGSNYSITTSSSPSAGGTTSGGGTYPAGSSRTVTATANSGYTFSNWTESGNVVSTSASYPFTLNSNRALIANFSANTVSYTITTSSSPSSGGTTSGAGTYPAGSSRTVTATANSGYTFSNWTESGNVVSTAASYTFTLNSNRTLVANFSANTVTYVISTSSSPSNGGTTSGGGTYAAGSSRTVTATANSGYTFSNWTESGSVVSTSASYTFTLNSNRTLVANFSANTVTYVISTSSSPSNGGATSGRRNLSSREFADGDGNSQ